MSENYEKTTVKKFEFVVACSLDEKGRKSGDSEWNVMIC